MIASTCLATEVRRPLAEISTCRGPFIARLHRGLEAGACVWQRRTCSPSLHVHAHVVRWAAENGLTYFDMSVGPASYKDQIGGQRSALYALDHAISLRGAAILRAMQAWTSLKAHVRQNPALHAAARGLQRRSKASPTGTSLIERCRRWSRRSGRFSPIP